MFCKSRPSLVQMADLEPVTFIYSHFKKGCPSKIIKFKLQNTRKIMSYDTHEWTFKVFIKRNFAQHFVDCIENISLNYNVYVTSLVEFM